MACGHCDFGGELEQNVHQVIKRVPVRDQQGRDTGESIDTVAAVYLCPSCEKLTLQSYVWSDLFDPEDVRVNTLYPAAPTFEGIPEPVASEYRRAQGVRSERVFYAVGIRRTLEAICKERGVEGRTLAARLQVLASSGDFPPTFAEMAEVLRDLGNLGAHVGEEEITEEDAAVLGNFADALVEYLYRAPAKVAVVRAALDDRLKHH